MGNWTVTGEVRMAMHARLRVWYERREWKTVGRFFSSRPSVAGVRGIRGWLLRSRGARWRGDRLACARASERDIIYI